MELHDRERIRAPSRHIHNHAGKPGSSGIFDFGFIDQHHRDVIADRVNPSAFYAFQSFAVFGQSNFFFT